LVSPEATIAATSMLSPEPAPCPPELSPAAAWVVSELLLDSAVCVVSAWLLPVPEDAVCVASPPLPELSDEAVCVVSPWVLPEVSAAAVCVVSAELVSAAAVSVALVSDDPPEAGCSVDAVSVLPCSLDAAAEPLSPALDAVSVLAVLSLPAEPELPLSVPLPADAVSVALDPLDSDAPVSVLAVSVAEEEEEEELPVSAGCAASPPELADSVDAMDDSPPPFMPEPDPSELALLSCADWLVFTTFGPVSAEIAMRRNRSPPRPHAAYLR
jgi:hypothetical protein